MQKIKAIIFLFFICAFAHAQNTITGIFPALSNQQIKLLGYNGFDTYTIDSVKVNEQGEFKLSYSQQNYGMAYLLSEVNKSFMLILDQNENITLRGQSFALPASIVIASGTQNQLFDQYSTEHPRREQTLSAWDYLTKIYQKDTLFAVQRTPQKAIEKEKQRIKTEDAKFLADLNSNTFVSYYLPIRKLVSSVSTIAQHRTEEIPAAMAAFRAINYTDNRLYKSGLLSSIIDSHFWLIENSGRPTDSMYIEMNKSIDCIVQKLVADELKLNEITGHLYKLLEKRSLFTASAYLAIKLLNESACTLNNDFAAQLENYRAMKVGNTAPDIKFNGQVFAPAYIDGNIPQTLSSIESQYTAVIFGASWCPQCPQELAQIMGFYDKWKSQGVEVLFVSLDEHKEMFKNFTRPFPFISTCDYLKWDSPAVTNYYVFATPTMFLLDNNRKIILRPNSANHLNSWIDWNLVQGNK